MQKFVTANVTEAEGLFAGDFTRDILFGMRFLERINLRVGKTNVFKYEQPMSS
jgi:hypothetical protein